MSLEHSTDLQAFCDAVLSGNVSRTRELLASEPIRAKVNEPMFAFGQRAAHIAAKNVDLLTALIDAGADVNRKSNWENGPYTVLDNADDDSARFLLTRGAVLTPNVAARLGWFDDLKRLIATDGALVHARGGDGQQPLHEAKTVAIADLNASIAQRYGIDRTQDGVLLLVTVRDAAGNAADPGDLQLMATAGTLTEPPKPLQLRSIQTEGLTDYIGVFQAAPPASVQFRLTATRGGARADIATTAELHPR